MQIKFLKLSTSSFKLQALCLGMTSLLLLSGCGGSGSEDTEFLGGNSDINVALPINGASASANYNDIVADKVIDDDTTSENWAGHLQDDYVTVDFGQTRNIKEFHIYTNDTDTDSSLIEVSNTSTNWFSTGSSSGADINCSNSSNAAPKISCYYNNRKQFRYIRFTTKLPNSEAGSLNVYEIQATGY